MNFMVKPVIADCASLQSFFDGERVGGRDLIVTNEYLLTPHLGGRPAPCDVLYQEKYGRGEPSDEMVDAMLAAIGGKSYERVIAIGGGTVIDIAKIFVFGGGMTCEEIFAQGASLPCKRGLVIIPTTCGTGSEVTGISIIEFRKKQTKLGLAVPALFADKTVLIPGLLTSMPFEVFATSSIDALIHATESYVSPRASPFSRSLARTAIEEILRGYQDLVKGGKKGQLPADLSRFLTASTMAGIAFGNAGVGAVHALSYPLGGGYHVPHGKANYMVFAKVFEAYRALGADLSGLENVLAGALDCAASGVWQTMFALINNVLLCQPLAEIGVDEEKCAEMAASVIKNQQRLLVNNPIPLTEKQIFEIYKRCL